MCFNPQLQITVVTGREIYEKCSSGNKEKGKLLSAAIEQNHVWGKTIIIVAMLMTTVVSTYIKVPGAVLSTLFSLTYWKAIH